MPTYVYQCPKCDANKEEYLQITQRNNVQVCSICNTIMDRLIGTGSLFYLKGKGFYRKGWQ